MAESTNGSEGVGASTEDRDQILTTWIRSAENETASIGITLLVGGLLVSGMTISLGQWLEALGGSLAKGLGNSGDGAQIGDLFKSRADEWRAERSKETSERFEPVYVHLKDVEIWSGNAFNKFPIWRGRLKSVDGWALGLREGR